MLFMGFREIFVTRMGQRIERPSPASCARSPSPLAPRLCPWRLCRPTPGQAHGRAQGQPVGVAVQDVNRTDFGLHSFGYGGDDPLESLLQVMRMADQGADILKGYRGGAECYGFGFLSVSSPLAAARRRAFYKTQIGVSSLGSDSAAFIVGAAAIRAASRKYGARLGAKNPGRVSPRWTVITVEIVLQDLVPRAADQGSSRPNSRSFVASSSWTLPT